MADNKAVARRFLECVGAHDIDGILGLITPTWRMTGGPPGLPALTPAAGSRFNSTFTHHLVDGLIDRTHRNADDLGRLLQLGATFQRAA